MVSLSHMAAIGLFIGYDTGPEDNRGREGRWTHTRLSEIVSKGTRYKAFRADKIKDTRQDKIRQEVYTRASKEGMVFVDNNETDASRGEGTRKRKRKRRIIDWI